MMTKLKYLTVLFLQLVVLFGCGKVDQTAGVVIDTSTLTAKLQGRSVDNLEGQWMRVYEATELIDSAMILTGGDIEVEYDSYNSLLLDADSLIYFAYRIIQTDTIRPSAPLRFLFPYQEAWTSNNAPKVIGWDTELIWDTTHKVWTTDSLPAGRHLIKWTYNKNDFSADLVVTEMANRFENHQFTRPIQAGSLRPKDCGFMEFKVNISQGAGLGCPHTESDAFNRFGVSSANMLEWNDSLIKFQLVTLSNESQTNNPYSKLLLEFGPNEEVFDISKFDSLSISMDLIKGDTIAVRLAQTGLNIGHWHYQEFGGNGLKEYTMPLDSSLLALNKDYKLDLTKIFGLEFRNSKSGRAILSTLHHITFK